MKWNLLRSIGIFQLAWIVLGSKLLAQCAVGTTEVVSVQATSGAGSFDDPAIGNVTIEFCLKVTEFFESSTNWMHGVFVAWDDIPSGFKVGKGSTGEQPTQHGNRFWTWIDTSQARLLGLPGPGYYVDDGDQIPGNNYGDNGLGTPLARFPDLHPFCFLMVTNCDIAPYNFRPKVTVTGDGTTGGWKNASCPGDRIISFATGPNNAGNVVVCGLVLPLKLISFEGTPRHSANLIRWSGIPDNLFSHFELEASTSLKGNFEMINRVPSKGAFGNTIEKHEYLHITDVPNSYYRLKMVDKDGSYSYSHIIHVQQKSSHSPYLKIYPNPTEENIFIQFLNRSEAARKSILLFDAQGKQMDALNLYPQIHEQTLVFNLGNLEDGVYYLEILDNDQPIDHVKIVKK